MKSLVPLIFFLPMLSSCNVAETQYYESGSYPPARVEMQPYHQQYYRNKDGGYRPDVRRRVSHAHPQQDGTHHAHVSEHTVAQTEPSQVHRHPERTHVHEHETAQRTSHHSSVALVQRHG